MATALIVFPDTNPAAYLNWAARFASAYDEKLLVLYAASGAEVFQEESVEEIGHARLKHDLRSFVDSSVVAHPGPPAVFRVDEANLLSSVSAAAGTLAIQRVLVPRERGTKSSAPQFELPKQIIRDLACTVVQLCLGDSSGETCEHIVVAMGTGDATAEALQLAVRLAVHADGQVSAVHVERDEGDLAEHAARRIAERKVADTVRTDRERVDVQIVTGVDVAEGLKASAEGHDLVILGASHHGIVHRWLFSSVSEKLMADRQGPTVAVVRPPIAWSSRVSRSLLEVVRDWVPQLDREKRIELFNRVQSASTWNFDFVALISLSTLIATLGLLQDSIAVVIGAMLVAPLMTPLLGIGLALTQGNLVLGKTSLRTVGLGFISSFCIGWLTAMVMPDAEITHEIVVRGSPGVTDLLVAFFSGLAAAYAIGRPNLLSALPGVAIAAALVPPVASSAIGLSQGMLGLAGGASLLFLTNIVAIVLGASLSFWLSGIRIMHTHGGLARWTRSGALVLLTLAIGLAAYESLPRDQQQQELHDAVALTLAKVPGARLEEVQVREHRAPRVRLFISGPEALPDEIRQTLHAQTFEAFPQAHTVEIQLTTVYRATPHPVSE